MFFHTYIYISIVLTRCEYVKLFVKYLMRLSVAYTMLACQAVLAMPS
jgi:hypothetical protein